MEGEGEVLEYTASRGSPSVVDHSTNAERDDLLAEYLPYCTVVPTPRGLPRIELCPDPGDIPFLQLAIVGRADMFVTGDKALLRMKLGKGRSVVAPDALLNR